MRYNTRMHEGYPAYAATLGALIIVVGAAVFVGWNYMNPRLASESKELPIGFPIEAPKPRAADATSAQKGFQYLVSYAGEFEPATVMVKKGETVRFTNTSNSTLRVVPESTPLGAQSTASPVLQSGEYWESAFDLHGVWTLRDASGRASIRITVQ